MKAYVAVTDPEWYRFLRQMPSLDEVNFWRPSGSRVFKALEVGEPLLFKLHHPENFITGGGFFTHFSILPLRLAWDAFGPKNGAASFDEMHRQIEKYRRNHKDMDPHADYKVGCIILRDPFFFDERHWIPAPDDFHPNIPGKGYDLTASVGRALWEEVLIRLRAAVPTGIAETPSPVYGEPRLGRERLGQGAFRVLVTDTYRRRCAVTGEKALPVLEAAHIRPVSAGGVHRIDNGLLLRSDVHTLFDRGYVTFTPDYRFRISQRLKEHFDDRETYR